MFVLCAVDHRMYSWGSTKRGMLGLGKVEAKVVNVPTVGEYISTYKHS